MKSTQFFAAPAYVEVLSELSAHAPANPFATSSYFESKRLVGYAPWVLGLRNEINGLECACGGFLRTGRLNRTLEVPSLPAVDADSPFWLGLHKFCQSHGVTVLELGTYGSPPGVIIPDLGTHCTRRNRCEFILDLSRDLEGILSSNHKRNLKKAQKAGLEMRRTRSAEAAITHHALMSESMVRRRSRGENISPVSPSPDHIAYLQTGVGELFQAVRGDTVLSSVLILRALEGGYYQSAGTSADGMARGASHFLIHSIANQLRAENVQTFNLGGGSEDSGLALFKEGFGAFRVHLPAAICFVGARWRREASRAASWMHSWREALLQLPRVGISRLLIYMGDTSTFHPAEPHADFEFRWLDPYDLRILSVNDPAFRSRQLERLDRFGTSFAYGVFISGEIAHISWLLPASAMKKDLPRVLPGRADEAEITCCETLSGFRGRGIYSVAIRNLVHVAREQGVRHVLMKTRTDNKASQKGIEKAGLSCIGWALLIRLPLTERQVVWRHFHRH